MIVVRDIFQLKFGKAKDALALMKEAQPMMSKNGYSVDRIMTDFTGPYYTLVMESSYGSLSHYDKAYKTEVAEDEWKKWYQRFVPLVESGRREIYTVVDQTKR